MSLPSQTVLAVAPTGEHVGLSVMVDRRNVWLGVRNNWVAVLDPSTAAQLIAALQSAIGRPVAPNPSSAEGDPRTVDPAELRAMGRALDRLAARLESNG